MCEFLLYSYTDYGTSYSNIIIIVHVSEYKVYIDAWPKRAGFYPQYDYIPNVLAVVTGPVHVRSQLRPLLTSWRGAFPHSVKEMTKEQASGSLQSWLIALENRTGALTCEWISNYMYAGYNKGVKIPLPLHQTPISRPPRLCSNSMCPLLLICTGWISCFPL